MTGDILPPEHGGLKSFVTDLSGLSRFLLPLLLRRQPPYGRCENGMHVSSDILVDSHEGKSFVACMSSLVLKFMR